MYLSILPGAQTRAARAYMPPCEHGEHAGAWSRPRNHFDNATVAADVAGLVRSLKNPSQVCEDFLAMVLPRRTSPTNYLFIEGAYARLIRRKVLPATISKMPPAK